MNLKTLEKIIIILRREAKQYEIPIIAAAREKYHSPFEVLVTTVLSAQTKDELTARKMPQIFARIQKPEDLVAIPVSELEKLLYPISFYRVKARNLKVLAKILTEEFDGKVPNTLEELMTFPGVGKKVGYIVLSRVYDKHSGIGVDVHVHRISNRFGFVRTKEPLKTEAALQKKLPQKYWRDYNVLLVKWGQNVCAPTSPWCSKCALRKHCERVGVKRSR